MSNVTMMTQEQYLELVNQDEFYTFVEMIPEDAWERWEEARDNNIIVNAILENVSSSALCAIGINPHDESQIVNLVNHIDALGF